MSIYFLNDVDKQLILEFKISFEKYHTLSPNNPKKGVFSTPFINLEVVLAGLSLVTLYIYYYTYALLTIYN